MRVHAVLLHYGTPVTTMRALAALADGSERPERVLVVDNGSPPGTAAPPAPGVEILTLDENLGFAGGCNVGIERARADGADAVLLVNSDAELAPTALAQLTALLGRSPRAGAVGPALERADARLEAVGMSWRAATGRFRLVDAGRATPRRGEPHAVEALTGAVMLLRTRALDEVGLFDEEYFFAVENLDLCLRLRAAGWEVLVDPAARARHAGSATIGAVSPRRLYFAARNHLRLGLRTAPPGVARAFLRQAHIAALHVAHAALRAPGPRVPALVAVARGIGDHLRRRYGPDGVARGRR